MPLSFDDALLDDALPRKWPHECVMRCTIVLDASKIAMTFWSLAE